MPDSEKERSGFELPRTGQRESAKRIRAAPGRGAKLGDEDRSSP